MLKKVLAISAWTLCVVLNAQASNEEELKEMSAGIFVCDEKEERCVRGGEEDSTLGVFHHQEEEGHLIACSKCGG